MSRDDNFTWIQWYPLKWIGDLDLQACSPATRGCWMNWLMEMWRRDTDRLTEDFATLGRLAGATSEQAQAAVDDLKTHRAAACYPRGNCGYSRSAGVTIVCRNFTRTLRQRKSKAAMMKRLRQQRKGNGVTAPLPSRSDRVDETREEESTTDENREEQTSGASGKSLPFSSNNGASKKPGPMTSKLIDRVLAAAKLDTNGINETIRIMSPISYSLDYEHQIDRMIHEVRQGKAKNDNAYVTVSLKSMAAKYGTVE